jgi:NAD+ synthase
MTPRKRVKFITQWIRSYARAHKISRLVVGISGGIDSAVVSALCARTGLPTIAVSMPIHQSPRTHSLSIAQGTWLVEHFENAQHRTVDLTPTFRQFSKLFDGGSELGLANSRSRLRMMCLYQIAQEEHGIVVGTGNRVEDFGVGFFTKYGDGGVDISPIGDCAKTEVWDMGRELGILPEIIEAAPTDGLWDDGRTDEAQLGMTYPELEDMMRLDALQDHEPEKIGMDRAQKTKLRQYQQIRARNLHKMLPIPVCKMPVDQ